MSGVRHTLSQMTSQLEESMGVRSSDEPLRLVPTASAKDIGRQTVRNVSRIDISQVVPDPQQPRTQFEDDSLQRLATSIRDKGQLSPIRVRWADAINKWIITTGERRWRACQVAGLATIDCCIQEGDFSTSHVLEEQLIENLLREELNPIEEARAFKTLIELNGWNGKQLAEALSMPASKVTRTLALLKLPATTQEQIAKGELAARSAYEISRLHNESAREEVARQATSEKWTHADTARNVGQRQHKSRNTAKPQLTFFTEGGWRVIIIGQRRGSYEEVEAALVSALDEVRHRIRNGVRWR